MIVDFSKDLCKISNYIQRDPLQNEMSWSVIWYL